MSDYSTISYTDLIDSAMRGVIRQVLRQVQTQGLLGDHHFYITFLTNYPGVSVSDSLKSRYPHEMTIVMQHQFWDFVVSENGFKVTLSFGGVPEPLVIPFASLVAFADPSVKFGLQFQKMEASNETLPVPIDYEQILGIDTSDITGEDNMPQAAEIISLDAFRKK